MEKAFLRVLDKDSQSGEHIPRKKPFASLRRKPLDPKDLKVLHEYVLSDPNRDLRTHCDLVHSSWRLGLSQMELLSSSLASLLLKWTKLERSLHLEIPSSKNNKRMLLLEATSSSAWREGHNFNFSQDDFLLPENPRDPNLLPEGRSHLGVMEDSHLRDPHQSPLPQFFGTEEEGLEEPPAHESYWAFAEPEAQPKEMPDQETIQNEESDKEVHQANPNMDSPRGERTEIDDAHEESELSLLPLNTPDPLSSNAGPSPSKVPRRRSLLGRTRSKRTKLSYKEIKANIARTAMDPRPLITPSSLSHERPGFLSRPIDEWQHGHASESWWSFDEGEEEEEEGMGAQGEDRQEEVMPMEQGDREDPWLQSPEEEEKEEESNISSIARDSLSHLEANRLFRGGSSVLLPTPGGDEELPSLLLGSVSGSHIDDVPGLELSGIDMKTTLLSAITVHTGPEPLRLGDIVIPEVAARGFMAALELYQRGDVDLKQMDGGGDIIIINKM